MQPIPYIFFRGDCAEALRTYARIFDAPEPQLMMNSQVPEDQRMPGPEGVMHGAVQVGDGWIYGSDDPEGTGMAGASIALSSKTVEESRRIFDALAEGGEVRMPLTPTFWGPGFGMLSDRFGTRWMIDTDAAPQGASAPPDGQGGAVA